MLKIKEMNEHVGISQQIQSNDDGSVVLVNVFTVDPSDEAALIAAWSQDAEFMKVQPGYISTQLHRGIAGSSTFFNYAIWENVESFKNAFSHSDFQQLLSMYPDSAVASPHLFKKLAVSGYCVA